MKKYTLFLLPAAFILLVSGCEKIEKIEHAGTIVPRLVVNCVAKEGEGFEFNISKSLNAIDNAPIKDVKTATVLLYADDVLKEKIVYSSLLGGYFSDSLYARQGVKYRMEVSAKGYETVTASMMLPKKVTIKYGDMKIQQVHKDTYSSGYLYMYFKKGKLSVQFDDPAEKGDYYMLQLKDVWSGSMRGYTNSYWDCKLPGAEAIQQYSPDGSFYFFQDEVFNGKTAVVDFEPTWDYNTAASGQDSLLFYEVTLHTLSKEYYNYIYSVMLAQQAQYDYFQQPVQVYSNVSGGYGVFGSRSRSTYLVKFPW